MRWSEEQFTAWQRAHQPRTSVPPSRAALSEEAFMAQVIRLAKEQGFLAYHTRDARRSEPGFPDLVLCKPGRLIFAELKSATGKSTVGQMLWLSLLEHSVPGVEVKLWRPQDWDEIVRTLQGATS